MAETKPDGEIITWDERKIEALQEIVKDLAGIVDVVCGECGLAALGVCDNDCKLFPVRNRIYPDKQAPQRP